MIFLYHFLSTLTAIAVIPGFAAYSCLTGRKRRGLFHHFGLVPELKSIEKTLHKPFQENPPQASKLPSDASPERPTLWLHALSLGEVVSAAPVLTRLKESRSDLRIVVSTTTDSGYDGALKHLNFVDQIIFHPFDCLPFSLLALNRINPDLFLLADTGFWPGLLNLLHRKKIPCLLFNGRISQRSFKRYRMLGKIHSLFFKPFKIICMQNEEGRNRILDLGVESSRVRVVGDSKFDTATSVPGAARDRLREKLRIRSEDLVWVAGSTHEGEEEIILDTYKSLKNKYKDLVLILAPRRPERTEEISRLFADKEILFINRTAIKSNETFNRNGILLDTLGELAEVYSICDVAFVGRSLVSPGGGHSLIEPISQGKPVLHGPYIENIRHVADIADKSGISIQVRDGKEMEKVMDDLLADENRRQQIARKSNSLLQEFRGASDRVADLVLDNLPT